VIEESYRTAAQKGSAVAGVPLKDSIRAVAADGTSQTADRTAFRLIQTPQTFRLSVIRQGFGQPEQPWFTDDASVAESAGFGIHLIPGSFRNIKITTPEDLLLAEALLTK
jgi:2-C-methyl-D-erythritol 4-phosphate cytidylyltransferase